jgi:hypothetical protein
MNQQDKKIIKKLLAEGFLVMVSDPDGRLFTERFAVYQGCSRSSLKAVVVDEAGNVYALQG